jgi:transglutaminase-like putative cysteine protease
MAIYAYLSLPQIFDKIKSLPYRPDPIEEEVLMRPRFTMNNQGSGGDCDDKAIALASYAKCVGIPYRFIAVRKDSMPVLHHVYTELYVNGQWIWADCTYAFNNLGTPRESFAEYVII